MSLGYLAVLISGFVVWLSYGIALWNFALIIPNTVTFLVGVTTFIVAWRLRSGPQEQAAPLAGH